MMRMIAQAIVAGALVLGLPVCATTRAIDIICPPAGQCPNTPIGAWRGLLTRPRSHRAMVSAMRTRPQPAGRCGSERDRADKGLLNEHSPRFARRRLHPYQTPCGFDAFLTTGKSLIARCRYTPAISRGAHYKYQYVNETAHAANV